MRGEEPTSFERGVLGPMEGPVPIRGVSPVLQDEVQRALVICPRSPHSSEAEWALAPTQEYEAPGSDHSLPGCPGSSLSTDFPPTLLCPWAWPSPPLPRGASL